MVNILIIILTILFFSVISAFSAEKKIGVILTGETKFYNEIHKSFMETLSLHGYGSGKVAVHLETPSPDPVSWSNAAKKLIAYEMEVIVSYGTPATLAVINETSDIPLVYAGVYDPDSAGIKGRNVTGISSKVPVITLLKNMKDIAPFKKLAVIFNDFEKDTLIQVQEIKSYEGQFGFESMRFNVKRPGDVTKVSGADAIFLTTSCTARHCIFNIREIARKNRIPSATVMGGGEESIVLTLTADPSEQGRVAAEMVMRILKGDAPGNIQREVPRKIEFVINLKEANELGLKIPFDILTSATRVIK